LATLERRESEQKVGVAGKEGKKDPWRRGKGEGKDRKKKTQTQSGKERQCTQGERDQHHWEGIAATTEKENSP